MRNPIVLVLAITSIAGLLACGRGVQRDLVETEQAVAQARAVQADVYAPERFQEAEDSLSKARIAMEAEREKFLLSRSYDGARTLLESAKQAAYRAFYEAKSRMDMAREETTEVLRAANSSLERARASLAKAFEMDGTTVDLDVLEEEIAELEATLADAERDLKTGNFCEAREKAESVISSAETLERTVASTLRTSTQDSPLAWGAGMG